MKQIILTHLILFISFTFSFAQDEVADSDEKVYTIVDQQARYKNGMADLYRFFNENREYPKEAIENKVEGKVFVNFIIEKDGSISNVKVRQGIGSGCDEEAIRLMELSKIWTPAQEKGEVVRMNMTLPIPFSLKTKTVEKKTIQVYSGSLD
ncbi:energy transducer TonB [Flammeovirga aprica]|uniref:Energy transducer TonB n=1 Tax=Flammeovirga aprica JL-4 TaxID=694437 RepID=A0A7X9S1C6_9BACT|nr:energy transducer TonB [Flammeovirga aprica]NME72603.1 energy transducer TonB [Flammeovirga aprica JL-4]